MQKGRDGGKLFAVDSQKRRNGGIYHVNDLPMNYSFTSRNKIKIPFSPLELRLAGFLFNTFLMLDDVFVLPLVVPPASPTCGATGDTAGGDCPWSRGVINQHC